VAWKSQLILTLNEVSGPECSQAQKNLLIDGLDFHPCTPPHFIVFMGNKLCL